ncbi:hypothetical protein V8B97DRAFT_1952162 [Scleroderma yunnanense]
MDMLISCRSESPAPLSNTRFSLDTSGIAGVFCGDQAVSAMGAVPLYKYWKWLGWYNSPGSYEIAKRYGGLANSPLFNGLFPGCPSDAATLFGMVGKKGPKFEAIHSGTVIEETSHVATLFMEQCIERKGKVTDGRQRQSVGVTITHLGHAPLVKVLPKQLGSFYAIFSLVPILVSICTCITCAFISDWFSCSMIVLGMLVSGISCFVICSGTFVFTHPEPAPGSPPGDGILRSEKGVVLLKGDEAAVNSITRSMFKLYFESEPNYQPIGWCSVLLMIQFLTQLLLILQGKLFGQVMFVTSIAVSWGYNTWLSSLNKEKIQRSILMDEILQQPTLTKYTLPKPHEYGRVCPFCVASREAGNTLERHPP